MSSKHYIKHLVEPESLLLIWQSPKDEKRKRLAVGSLFKSSNGISLKYLTGTRDFQEACKLGFTGYSAFGIEESQYDDVLPSFARRLPPEKREDFNEYLEGFRISAGSNLSTFALLGYTGAKLPSDTFSLLNTFDNVPGPFEFLLEVAGFRFEDVRDSNIQIGDTVNFVKENNIELAEPAIRIMQSDIKIGYVTRGLVSNFNSWLDNVRVKQALVEKQNGTQDRPTLFLYVEIA